MATPPTLVKFFSCINSFILAKSGSLTTKDFKMEVQATFSRPILRQSMEGVSLAMAVKARDLGAEVKLMNSRREFYQPGVVRGTFAPVHGEK